MTQAAAVLAIVLAWAMAAHGENKKEAKHDAGDLYKQAKSETDPDLQVQEMCQAAALDKKEKKYQKECDALMATSVARQMARLNLAEDALDTRHDFKAARELTRKVAALNDDLANRKTTLLAKIDAAERAANEHKAPPPVDHSADYLAKMDADFAKGDFVAAITDFQMIRNPAIKVAAQHRRDDIDRYNGLISQAQTMEQAGDVTGAINAYQAAQQICANGPGNAAEEIRSLTERLKKKALVKNTTDQTPNPVEAQVKALLTAGHTAESAKKWQDALDQYNAALKLSPGNKEAQEGVDRVQPQLATDSDGREKILRAAIRAFYASSFESAKTSLQIYLNEQSAANRGVADFYLGAAVLEQSILRNKPGSQVSVPQEAADAFKRAHSEGYKPLPEYVAPAVLKAWNAAGL
jgi:tetratricopeptide (TPR) repeat protein